MDKNVLLKKQSALNWLKKINELKSEDRDDCEWSYVLLGENTFYSMNAKGASIALPLFKRIFRQKICYFILCN